MRLLGLLPLAALLVAGCLGDAPPGQASAAQPLACWLSRAVTPEERSASEVSIAINPLDPDHVVAAANGFEIATTLDGGATWTSERVTGLDLSTSGNVMVPAASLSDPAVAFGPDGTLHIAALAYVPASAVLVLSRTEPSAPWRVSTVWQSEVAGTMNDKEWLGVHPQTGTLLVAWQREPAMDQLRGVEPLVPGSDLDVGIIVVSRSNNGGETWSLPETVSSSLHNNGTQVAFTADGRAHLLWVDYEMPGLVHSVSDDDGLSWSPPAPVADLHMVGAFDGFTRMHTLPGLAAHGDRLAAAWHDARFDTSDVLVSIYEDGAWSAPLRVPDDAEGSGRIQFYPWLAFDEASTLHVTYYSGTADTNFTYRHASFAGSAWSEPTPLGPAFPLVSETGVVANLGDYTGAAAHGQKVHAAWAQPREGVPGSGVFVARLATSPACA